MELNRDKQIYVAEKLSKRNKNLILNSIDNGVYEEIAISRRCSMADDDAQFEQPFPTWM